VTDKKSGGMMCPAAGHIQGYKLATSRKTK